MSSAEAYDENRQEEDIIHWSSFEQYEPASTKPSYIPRWSNSVINNLVEVSHPLFLENKQPNDNKLCNKQNQESKNNEAQRINGLANFYIGKEIMCTCDKMCTDNGTSSTIHSISCVEHYSKYRPKEFWDGLVSTSHRKKYINKRTVTWRNYLTLLPLRLNDGKDISKESSFPLEESFNSNSLHSLSPLTSDTSDSEESDIMDTSDPIYSRFGILRNGFHISDDGMVFCSQSELDKYNKKMAEMKQVLQVELEQIQHQHKSMRAKRAEEKRLLSERIDSPESDLQEEPTESHSLNSKDSRGKSKPERKSALFSSIQDAFSYARTGFQGLFEKTSPNPTRKTRSHEPDYESNADSDEEGETLKTNSDASVNKSVYLPDNHDEFTRQMTAEGGLKYQSGNKTVQQLSYQSLPPPLSLDALPATDTHTNKKS